jgi:hypothetical protein
MAHLGLPRLRRRAQRLTRPGTKTSLIALAVLALVPLTLAPHTPGCGGHQGEPALLGCDNQSSIATQFTTAGEDTTAIFAFAPRTGESTGVFAFADIAVNAEGGIGVLSFGDFRGVDGSTFAGTGVRGTAADGIGVHATADNAGTALKVDGKASFSRSGLAIFPPGRSFIAVTGVSLTSSSLVLATVQARGIDGVFIKGVLTVPTQSKFNIYLNQAVPAGNSLSVAWLVLN